MAVADGPRVAALDGLRGAATFVVIAYHLEMSIPIPGDRVLPGGFAGVDVFFALSGYLITSQLLAAKARAGRLGLTSYAAKRAVRLWPLLVVFLAASALYEWIIGTSFHNIAWTTVTNLFFLPAVAVEQLDPFILSLSTWHLWSLAVEVHFYVLIPFLVAAVLQDRRPTWLAAGSLFVLIAAIVVMRHDLVGKVLPLSIYGRTTARIDTLLIGAAAAVLLRRARPDPRLVATCGSVAFGLLALWAMTVENTSVWLAQGGFTVVAVAAAALVIAVATGVGPSHLFEWGPLPSIGRVSYGLYVWHALVILAVARWLGWLPWPVQVAAAIGITAAVTLLCWRYVEQPTLAMLRRWLDKRRAKGEAAATALIPEGADVEATSGPALLPGFLEPPAQPQAT